MSWGAIKYFGALSLAIFALGTISPRAHAVPCPELQQIDPPKAAKPSRPRITTEAAKKHLDEGFAELEALPPIDVVCSLQPLPPEPNLPRRINEKRDEVKGLEELSPFESGDPSARIRRLSELERAKNELRLLEADRDLRDHLEALEAKRALQPPPNLDPDIVEAWRAKQKYFTALIELLKSRDSEAELNRAIAYRELISLLMESHSPRAGIDRRFREELNGRIKEKKDQIEDRTISDRKALTHLKEILEGHRPLPKGVPVRVTVHRSGDWDIKQWNVKANHRYSRPGVGAIYTTTLPVELEHYNQVKVEGKVAGPRIAHVELDLVNVLDLTDPEVRKQLGVTLKQLVGDGYLITHAIGDFAQAAGYQALKVPSGQTATGAHVLLFDRPERAPIVGHQRETRLFDPSRPLPEVSSLDEVVKGNIGILTRETEAPAESLVHELEAQGHPVKFIATVLEKPPEGAVQEESGIFRLPDDAKGRRHFVVVSSGSVEELKDRINRVQVRAAAVYDADGGVHLDDFASSLILVDGVPVGHSTSPLIGNLTEALGSQSAWRSVALVHPEARGDSSPTTRQVLLWSRARHYASKEKSAPGFYFMNPSNHVLATTGRGKELEELMRPPTENPNLRPVRDRVAHLREGAREILKLLNPEAELTFGDFFVPGENRSLLELGSTKHWQAVHEILDRLGIVPNMHSSWEELHPRASGLQQAEDKIQYFLGALRQAEIDKKYSSAAAALKYLRSEIEDYYDKLRPELRQAADDDYQVTPFDTWSGIRPLTGYSNVIGNRFVMQVRDYSTQQEKILRGKILRVNGVSIDYIDDNGELRSFNNNVTEVRKVAIRPY